MFTVVPGELQTVRDALLRESSNLGVGLLHLPTGRIALRPFDDLPQRGGHVELTSAFGWRPEDCLGFIVSRPAGEFVMVNLSQLNTRAGPLHMPPGTFRNLLLSLRQCWAGMAAYGSPG